MSAGCDLHRTDPAAGELCIAAIHTIGGIRTGTQSFQLLRVLSLLDGPMQCGKGCRTDEWSGHRAG